LRRFQNLLLMVLLVLPALASAQTAPPSAPTLQVSGLTGPSIVLTEHDLNAMPRETANVVDEKGNHVAFEGVPIIEILRRVGTPTGKDLRGKQMALYVLVSASDGYHAVFALAELDPAFADRHILLVDRRDGKDLSSAEGPFRIVAPGEKRHARWVHNVTSLAVKSAQ
jgi:hypothetical protein